MTDKEKLACLTDRPCQVCKHKKENGCCKWSCVFEEESESADIEKLKPCPFCGHDKSHITQKKVGGSYHNWTDSHSEFVKIRYCVMCNKCKATGKSVVTPKMYYRPIESLGIVKYSGETCRYYEKQAILAWNHRIGG